jgi:hypothetical protein
VHTINYTINNPEKTIFDLTGYCPLLNVKIIPLQISDSPAGFIKPGTLGIFPDQPAIIIQGGTDVPAGAIRLQKLAVEPPGFVAARGVGFPKLIQDR